MMKKFFLLILIGFFCMGGYLYYYFDSIVHSKVEEHLSRSLGVNVSIDHVFFKIFDGKFAFKGIKIANPEGFTAKNALVVNKVDVSIDMKTIFEDLLIIKHVKIESPELFYEIGANGDNIRAIKKRIGKKNKSTTAISTNSNGNITDADLKSKKIIIYKFFINSGIVSTEIKNIKKKELKLPDIYLQNIGKDKNGVTVANAADQVMRELLKAISKVNLRSLFDDISNIPNSIPGIKDSLKDKFKGKTEGFLKNLIKK